jgi:hypothetical protein
MSKKTKFIVRAFLLLMCLFPGTKDVEFEGWGMKLKIHTPTHKAPGEVLFLCPEHTTTSSSESLMLRLPKQPRPQARALLQKPLCAVLLGSQATG